MSRPKRSQTTWRLSSSSTGVAHIVFAGNNFEGALLARFLARWEHFGFPHKRC